MCRWLGYAGSPVYLEEVMSKPRHSLIEQSLHSRTGATATNGDGFGIGWYGERDTPGVYRDIEPAWNDSNLRDLMAHIESPLFLAHVRATSGSEVQRTNCHPFRYKKWLFVHNGQINEIDTVKRDIALAIAPALFPKILGTTDSELLFYLALTFGLEEDAAGALEKAVGFVERVCAEAGIVDALQLSAGLTDGERLLAVRYSSDGETRTLFHSRSLEALVELRPNLRRFSPETRLVVSEPLGDLSDAWEEIPESIFVTISGGEVQARGFEPRPPD